MDVTVVVGGQYGSEGKGKLVAHIARASARPVSAVRCGGPNSGHTVDFDGRPYPLRQLPSAAVIEGASLFLGAGMIVDPVLLAKEIADLRLARSRVRIDRNAVILDDQDLAFERHSQLRERLGSTLSGTGSATARKVLRDPNQMTAKDHPQLQDLVINVSSELNALVDRGETVIVEGTQGMGLSLHHSSCFPFATSRDTSAAAFLSEVGLAPMLVTDVIVVFRTFPIRVAGNSGPLPGEITWEGLALRAGSPAPFSEVTTVTKKTRRVGAFDWDQALEAVRLNRPTGLAVHGLDYLNFDDRGVTRLSNLSSESSRFISQLEHRLEVPVHFLFTGPRTKDIIDLRSGAEMQSEGMISVNV